MIKHIPSPINYREDINGLRTWAVLGVLFFHFSLIGLPSGFIGVDMFFVISGYLMTAITISGLEKEKFNIFKFYMARIRRILPALIFLIVCLLIFGWFWLPTIDYKVLGTQSISALSFISNIYYYLGAGYFDTNSHEKWLLHTWSLAVEAQFYITYPLILFVFWKIRPKLNILLYVILIIFISSFAVNLFYSTKDLSATFYLLPMRAWELCAGGIVYLILKKQLLSNNLRNYIFILGWIFTIGSFIFINQDLLWPSYWALFPVIGISLIILSNNQTSIFTNNFLFQWIGDRSYSIYLWHWPFVVALYFKELQNEWGYVLSAFSFSILLGHLSFKYIETPTRKYLDKSNLLKEILIIGFVTFLVVIGAFLIKKTTFKNRLAQNIEIASNGRDDINPRTDECLGDENTKNIQPCKYGDKEISAILIGDSHADTVVTSLYYASNSSVLQWNLRGCSVIKDAKISPWYKIKDYTNCIELPEIIDKIYNKEESLKNIPLIYLTKTNKYLFGDENTSNKIANSKPSIYFGETPISNSNDKLFQKQFIDAYVKNMCEINKHRQVYLVRPIPEMEVDVPRVLSRKLLFNDMKDDIKISIDAYYKRNELTFLAQDTAAKECGVKILNPLPYLCDDKYCYGSKNGHALYFDDNHMSEYGNKLLIPMFKEIFNEKK